MDKEFNKISRWELNNELILACQNGDLETVKYLLNSSETKNRVDIHVDDDKPFRTACMFGNLNIVKYLATSSELKNKANISANDDDGFIWAAIGRHYEICKFLIFEMDLKKSKVIDEFMDKIPTEAIDKMWAIKEINQNLHKEIYSEFIRPARFRV